MSYQLLYEQALQFHECGNFDEAETFYRQLLEVSPKNPDILNLLGLVAQAKGVHQQAVELFYQAIKLAPDHLPYKFNLALSLEHLEKYFEAISYYTKVPIKESFNNIGRIYFKLGKLESAQANFERALEMDPNYSEALANLAMTYDKSLAIKTLKKIKDPLAYEYLALLYIEDQSWDKALECAIQTANDELIGLIYAQKGEPEAAQHYLNNINTAPALINSANIATNEGDFGKAEQLYQQALATGRSVYDAHLNYGRMLYLQGRIAEALEQYRQAVVANPYAPEASNNLGAILRDMGEYEEALGLFFNAYMIQPTREDYAINISETILLFAQQNSKNALKIAKNWQKKAKNDVFAQNTLKILQGKDVDRLYTKKLFDQFAESYEDVLEKINSQVVKELKKALGKVVGRVLDLGCGTGLVGQKLKNKQNRFVGVDLSSQMLEKAREKNVYESLVEADIIEYLKKGVEGIDQIVAADVFNYFKDLRTLIKLCQGVPLAFSIESGEGMVNGRYKHNPCKVHKLLVNCGYCEITQYPVVLRKENNLDVEGIIFAARPNADGQPSVKKGPEHECSR